MRSIFVVLAITSAFAQETRSVVSEEAWEYCWVEGAGARMIEGVRNFQGSAQVCYANSDRCQTETVELPVPDSDMNGKHEAYYEQQAKRRVLTKTLAKLGRNGWELVSVSSQLDGQVFYMKKRIQSANTLTSRQTGN